MIRSFVLLFFSFGLILAPHVAHADFNCGRQIADNGTGNCVSCYKRWFGRTPPSSGCFSCSAWCFPLSPNGGEELSSNSQIASIDLIVPDYAVVVDAEPCLGNIDAGLTKSDFEGQQVAMWTPTEILDLFPPFALELGGVDLSDLPNLVEYALLMQRVDQGYINPIIAYDFEARMADFSDRDIESLSTIGAADWMDFQSDNIDLAEFAATVDRNFLLKIDPSLPDEQGLHSRIVISVERLGDSRVFTAKTTFEVELGPVVARAPVRYSDNYLGNVYAVRSIRQL